MTTSIILILALAAGDAASSQSLLPPVSVEDAAGAAELAAKASTSYMVRRYDRAIPQYEQLVAANPTVGFYWYRLGMCALSAGQYEKAITAFTRSNELGAFQWNPVETVHRGESAWGLAAAHARLGHTDEAIRWTRTSLGQGLRDIRKFHEPYFEKLLEDPQYRKLVWKVDAQGLSREEGLRLDLQFFMHEAKRIHYAPFRQTSEGEFDSLASRLSEDIPSLNDDQVLVRLMDIARRLGDGHTQVHRVGKSLRLPVQFFRFSEGLYITAALADRADLVGAKVLKIGNRSADEAWRTADEVVSRDNPMTVLAFTASVLASRRVLAGLDIAPGDGPVPLEIEDAPSKTRTVELAAVESGDERPAWTQKVPGCEAPLPRSLAHREKMYWFEEVPEQKLVYFQYNGIGNDPREWFNRFCKRLFEAVDKPEVEALVIDMRYNGGGNTFTNVPLIEGIIRCEKLQQPGRLFVITGRHTFSAAQNTTDELERRTKAILVGEPTGSCPNFIGESIHIPFPYSGWAASLSDLWWQTSMSMDYRVWVNPQLYAPPTAAAFRAHRDVPMETITAYRAKMAEKRK